MARTSSEDTMAKESANLTNEQMPQRERYWGELAIEEKFERMREIVKSLVLTQDRLQRELSDTRSFIWEHAHEENGDVVIKIKKNESYKLRDNGVNGLGGKLTPKQPLNNEVYF